MTSLTVAEQDGVNGSAIRLYERQGLITATRAGGNQRRFDEHAACRVRVAQRIGLRVEEIFDVIDGLIEEPTLEDWQRLHRALVPDAQRRIAGLNEAPEDTSAQTAGAATSDPRSLHDVRRRDITT